MLHVFFCTETVETQIHIGQLILAANYVFEEQKGQTEKKQLCHTYDLWEIKKHSIIREGNFKAFSVLVLPKYVNIFPCLSDKIQIP